MEGDRWLQLIFAAGIDGEFDYSNFDPLDPNHYLKEAYCLRRYEDKRIMELLTLKFHRTRGEELPSIYSSIGKLMLPWLDWGTYKKGTISEEEIGDLWNKWQARFGSLNDPVVRETLADLEVQQRVKEKEKIAINYQGVPKGVDWVYR